MGLPAVAADYLFVGPLIVARLQAETSLAVDLVETAEQLTKADHRAAVLGVMWAGDRVPGDEGKGRGGASQLVHQRWLVLLMLNNAGQQADARQAKAGALLSKVHAALAGWMPEGAGRTLARAQATLPPQLTASRALYPLGFEITLAL